MTVARFRIVLIGVAYAVVLAGLAAPVGAAKAVRPNIVFFLADDMGYGDPQCYCPASKVPTPRIDRLSREGMMFTDAHSPASICTPTRYGVLTGRYCWRSGLKGGVLWYWDPPLIEKSRLTMGKMLQQAGYATAAIGKWHLGMNWPLKDGSHVREHTKGVTLGYPKRAEMGKRIDFAKPILEGPTTRGFDSYFGTDVPNFPPYCFIENDRTVGIPTLPKPKGMYGRCSGPMIKGWDLEQILPTLTKRAVAYIDNHARTNRDKPFFLYFASTAPHTPIRPAKQFQGKSEAGPYGDLVHQVDWTLGQILDALERNGLADNTIVVFTSDNGSPARAGDPFVDGKEAAVPGAVVTKYGHNPSGKFRGMKWNIWEGGHRVPLIVRWPAKIKPAQCAQTVSLVDFMRTFAGIVGQKLTRDAAEDSCDIMPLLTGTAGGKPIREATVFHSGGFAIRQGKWKLITGLGKSGRGRPAPGEPAGQLYDITADPGEQTNLYRDNPDVVKRLGELLEKYKADGRSVGP